MRERLRKDILHYGKAFLLFLFIYIGMEIVFGTTCVTKLLFGLPCPFCGTTRAMLLCLCFRFKEAWQMQPLFPFVAAGLPLWLWDRYGTVLRKVHGFLLYFSIVMIAALILYVYRMIHFFPETEPMTWWSHNLLFYFVK